MTTDVAALAASVTTAK